MCQRRSIAALAMLWLLAAASANPMKRDNDLEARRRSAINRSIIRFGRSPPEVTAADIREAFQRPTRKGDAFLRFGKSEPITITTEDLINLLRSYEDYDSPASKRSTSFIRLGRDPKFIRLGRAAEEEKPNYVPETENQQRKGRGRDHFLRLGRDSEELNDSEEIERERRSV